MQVTNTHIAEAGDLIREIYSHANGKLPPSTTGDALALVVELFHSTDPSLDTKERTGLALDQFNTLRNEMQKQNAIFRGSDFARFIANADSAATCRALLKTAATLARTSSQADQADQTTQLEETQ